MALDTCHEGRTERRVVRGGSFNNNARNVRCAVRNRNNPHNRNMNNGFRVVVASHIVLPAW
jgi:formylglycine-generating enzyme required for sulfatase activity